MSILISPSNEDAFSSFGSSSFPVSGLSASSSVVCLIAALLFLDEADGLLKSVHELFKILFV